MARLLGAAILHPAGDRRDGNDRQGRDDDHDHHELDQRESTRCAACTATDWPDGRAETDRGGLHLVAAQMSKACADRNSRVWLGLPAISGTMAEQYGKDCAAVQTFQGSRGARASRKGFDAALL
jgi:hypothetical protein